MKIQDLKDLKALIKLCRQTGVEAIELDGVKMNLGPTPTIYKVAKAKSGALSKTSEESTSYPPNGITADMQIPTNGLTEEQMLFYSSEGNNSPPDQQ